MTVTIHWRSSQEHRILRWASRVFFVAGCLALGFCALAYFDAELYQVSSQLAIRPPAVTGPRDNAHPAAGVESLCTGRFPPQPDGDSSPCGFGDGIGGHQVTHPGARSRPHSRHRVPRRTWQCRHRRPSRHFLSQAERSPQGRRHHVDDASGFLPVFRPMDSRGDAERCCSAGALEYCGSYSRNLLSVYLRGASAKKVHRASAPDGLVWCRRKFHRVSDPLAVARGSVPSTACIEPRLEGADSVCMSH